MQQETITKKPFEPRDPDWNAKVRASFDRQTFMRTIGAKLVSLSPGRCEVELPFRADLCQQNGYLHGGLVTTIAANATGYAAFSLMPANSSVLGTEYKINLLNPAAGERFVAVGQVLRDMPLFLSRDGIGYIEVPLEQTYQAAYAGVPRRYRTVLEAA